MMIHSALVHWLSAKERGRTGLPATFRYVGIARFAEDGPHDDAWSVELRFHQPPPEGSSDVSEAKVQFLFETAPQERLSPGVRFGVYEGQTKVADVHVLD